MVNDFLCGTDHAYFRVDRWLPSSTVDPLLWAYWTDSTGKKDCWLIIDLPKKTIVIWSCFSLDIITLHSGLKCFAFGNWKMAHQVLPTPRVLCPGTFLLFFFPLFSKDRSQNIPTIWRVYLDSGNVMTCHAGGGPIHFVSFEAMVLRPRRQRDVPDGSLWGPASYRTALHCYVHSMGTGTSFVSANWDRVTILATEQQTSS